MTEKRFTLKYIEEQHISANLFDDKIFIGSIGIGAELIVELLNTLSEENKQLKKELQRIYDIATVNKVKNIVEEIYDDLLYETSEESDYARKKVLKCLEKIDDFGDDLND